MGVNKLKQFDVVPKLVDNSVVLQRGEFVPGRIVKAVKVDDDQSLTDSYDHGLNCQSDYRPNAAYSHVKFSEKRHQEAQAFRVFVVRGFIVLA